MAKFEICNNIFVGNGCPTFVIAEGGINHQGDVQLAKQLIKSAKKCGADCIKFQKRTINRILTKEGLQRPYVNDNSFGATYGEHKEALELTKEEFISLKHYADEHKIPFTASGWDEESIDFLDKIGVPFFKMASADLTNLPLLEHTAKKGKPMIISTGMANMDDVKIAYELISKYINKIIILQCTSSYPAPFNQLDLNVISTFEQTFPKAVIGYSGHEKGIAISTAAVAIGAKVVERHFTLDRTMKGGDHAASLEPQGLEHLIRDIHHVDDALGGYEKKKQISEEACFKKLTKSLVSNCDISANTVITRDMLTTKGPGTGISPKYLNYFIGKKSNVNIPEDVIIQKEWFD